MANTYQQQYQAFISPEVRGIVTFAAIKAATDIMNSVEPDAAALWLANEIATGSPTDYSDNARNRAITAFALETVRNPTVLGTLWANDTLTPGNASASDLDFVVAGAWQATAERLSQAPDPAVQAQRVR